MDAGTKNNTLQRIEALPGILAVLPEEPLRDHTTFRIGGPAEFFVTVGTVEGADALIRFAGGCGMPLRFLGFGSNVLAPDEGLRGITAVLAGDFQEIRMDQASGVVKAGAGVSLANLAAATAKEGLAGLAFAGGIPGSVGGGILMNAGAYGGEMKDVLREAEVLIDGTVRTMTAEELQLSYRHSVLMERPGLILSGTFVLQKEDPEKILAEIRELNHRRQEKQPLNYPSAGSAFKRPEGYFAAALIEECGLKGKQVGGAAVSEKHSGFIVNLGGATAADVRELIRVVQETVAEQKGVRLEPEIRIL